MKPCDSSSVSAADQEPYWLLFRKSATPLAITGPEGMGYFIDWCVLRSCHLVITLTISSVRRGA